MKHFSRSLLGLVLYLSFVLSIVPSIASAYIDPSTTTFLIQAIIGVAVAVVGGITIYWRKAKKRVNQVLGRDDKESSKAESDDIEL